MKLGKLVALLLISALWAVSDGAWAHGPRTRIGVYVGPSVYWGPSWGPAWGPGWYYPPPYYSPPPVVVLPPSPPPVYVEQPREEPVEQYWYYCKSGKAYYPYVKDCPEGWQRVLPQPEKQ